MDVSKCHACHTRATGMSASALPHKSHIDHACHTKVPHLLRSFIFFPRDMANMLCDTVLYTQKQRAETNWRLHSARDCWSKQIGSVGHQETTKQEGPAEATTRSSPSQNCVSSLHQREATANGARAQHRTKNIQLAFPGS